MRIISSSISIKELATIARERYGNMVKAVVDLARGVMAIDAEMHADEEAYLIEEGSAQQDLWGINIYPEAKKEDRIEFDSMINLRPALGNRSRGVEDAEIRNKIIALVDKLIEG